MSNVFQNFLSGVFGADGYMKDFAHASRLYRDTGFYDYAPKAGWNYYVRMGINSQVRSKLEPSWAERHMPTIGVLAKQVDLPKFKITTETVNQYNRKVAVQTKLNYDPISITFHDDMANATTDLWKNYYQYYFADSNVSVKAIGKGSRYAEAYKDNKYSTLGSYAYGLANGQTNRFFDSIEIFLLNRKKFQSFILINPIIKSWQHGEVDQTTGNRVLENKMTIEYESVVYNKGRANQVGFRGANYDNSPSPLATAGLGGITGAGGLLQGAEDLFGTIADVDASTSVLDAIDIALQTANLAKNISKINSQTLKQEAYSILGGVLYEDGGSTVDIANRTGNAYAVTGLYSAAGTGAVNLYKQYNNKSVTPGTVAQQRSVTGK